VKLAPVALFVYNRPLHAQKTTERLKMNELAGESDLFIFSDGPKDEASKNEVAKVRAYIRKLKGFKHITIFEKESNMGLAKSIITGVTEIINRYHKIIVIEDDIVTSQYFLKYMNEGLNYYENYKNIFSISGYNHPPTLMKFPRRYREDIYFNYRNSSWGWGTWSDRWGKADWEVKDYSDFLQNKEMQNRFNRSGDDMTAMLIAQMEGKIDSWAIRWCYAHFKNNALSVCPVYSYVDNIGNDGTGTHCGVSSMYSNDLKESKENCSFIRSVEVDKRVINSFKKVYQSGPRFSLKKTIKNLILYDLWKK
jgi:hypothetical protein